MGSIHGNNANIVVRNTTFIQNFASKSGAGVSEQFNVNVGDSRSFIAIIGCDFSSNTSPGSAGAVLIVSVSASFGKV